MLTAEYLFTICNEKDVSITFERSTNPKFTVERRLGKKVIRETVSLTWENIRFGSPHIMKREIQDAIDRINENLLNNG